MSNTEMQDIHVYQGTPILGDETDKKKPTLYEACTKCCRSLEERQPNLCVGR